MNKEEITKEDVLNITGNIFDTFLDYVDNSNEELEQLQQENKQLKEDIHNIINIINKNCDDLETTEEEFNSLDRWCK